MRRIVQVAAVLLCSIIEIPRARAGDPMLLAGFAPHTVQDGDLTGHVNVMNGALNLEHGFGSAYRVNAGLSYGLTRVYSSGLRKWRIDRICSAVPDPCCAANDCFDAPPLCFNCLAQLLENRYSVEGRSQIGWGWFLGFGRVTEDLDSGAITYQGPDGVAHQLVLDGASGEFRTRDTAFLRAIMDVGPPARWRVWTPDGVMRLLDHEIASGDMKGFYATRVFDPMGEGVGQSVTIEYESATGTKKNCIAKVFDDVHGSSALPLIEFQNTEFSEVDGGLTTVVKMRRADGSQTRYELEYDLIAPMFSECSEIRPTVAGGQKKVPLLRKVKLDDPEVGKPDLLWEYSYDGNGFGLLTEVKLPDGLARGVYQYDCVSWDPQRNCSPSPNHFFTRISGVKLKKVFPGDGACDGDTDVDCWSYGQCMGTGPGTGTECESETDPVDFTCPDQQSFPNSNPKKAWVIDPRGFRTLHFFNWGCIGGLCGRNGLLRRTEYYEGSGALVRATEQDHEFDSGLQHNPRVNLERTIFVERDPDTEHAVVRSGWDGAGHFRFEEESQTEGATSTRCSFTNYLPDTSTWHLEKYDQKVVMDGACTSGNVVADMRYRFDEFGRLLGERRRLVPGADTAGAGSPNPDATGDSVSLHGWQGWEKTCTESCTAFKCLPLFDSVTSINMANCDSTACAPPHRYLAKESYSHGTLGSAKAVGTTFFTTDRDIADNGQPVEMRDAMAAHRRELAYDFADRLKTVRFFNVGSQEELDLNLSWTGAARLSWNRGDTAARGVIKYDRFGRRRQERLESPDDGLIDYVRTDKLDYLGNAVDSGHWCRLNEGSSEPPPPPDCEKEVTDGFDLFGRPARVLRGTDPVVEWTYTGMTTTERRYVKTATGADTPVDKVLVKDAFGRLIRVEEPQPAGSPRIAHYGYDAQDRLRTVDLCKPDMSPPNCQKRTFTYNPLGYLTLGEEPESGATEYTVHDPTGRPLKGEDSLVPPTTLAWSYDCLGRTTAASAGATTATWTFDQSGFLGRRTASSYGDTTHSYEYNGVGARLSNLKTQVFGGTGYQFEHAQTYNDLGLPDTLTYPSAAGDDLDALDGVRTVLPAQQLYQAGFLDRVKDLTAIPAEQLLLTAFDHAPHGAFSKIDFRGTGAVFFAREFDKRNRFQKVRSGLGTTDLFDTGVYGYDRSDNVAAIGADLFEYTRRSELAKATYPGPILATYEYDHYGNLRKRTGLEPFEFMISESTNRISNSGFLYSPRGELTADPDHDDLDWDGMQRLSHAETGGQHAYFVYDAEGHRVDTTAYDGCGEGRHLYLRGDDGATLSEYQSAPTCQADGVVWLRDYVYAEGQLVATRQNATAARPVLWTHVCTTAGTPVSVMGWVAEAEANRCRATGVNIYVRRSTNPAYDFTTPIGGSPNETRCPQIGTWTWSTTEAATWCFVARSIHRSGEFGPQSVEHCVSPNPLGCPLPVPPTTCPPSPVTEMANWRYHATDHLGTPRVTWSPEGQILETLKLGPYGEEIDPAACDQRKQFTGHDRDPETGFDYMMARYYAKSAGRFLSTDPEDSALGPAPLSWNAYLYALNSPMRYVDVDGESPLDHAVGVAQGFFRTMLLLPPREAVNNPDFSAGQEAGSIAAAWVAVAEAKVGMDLMAGGGTLTATVVGAEVGVPAFGVGLGLAAHGSLVAAAHAIRSGADDGPNAGTYDVRTQSGTDYVGQSRDVPTRLQQHVESGKVTQEGAKAAKQTRVKGGKTAREVAEQKRINKKGGIEKLANKRNPIGKERQHLLKKKSK